ncbi:hypothetical protein D3C80_1604660 [compost metagenome]
MSLNWNWAIRLARSGFFSSSAFTLAASRASAHRLRNIGQLIRLPFSFTMKNGDKCSLVRRMMRSSSSPRLFFKSSASRTILNRLPVLPWLTSR